MTSEEAIQIIKQEIKCVKRDCNIERACGHCDLAMPSREPIIQAYEMAIKALDVDLEEYYQNAFENGWLKGANEVRKVSE